MTDELYPGSLGGREVVISQRGALALAVDMVAPEIASWAGITEELTDDTKRFLAEYCSAVRSSVLRYRHEKTGEVPSREDLEIARLGDIMIMADTLVSSGFLKIRQDVIDVVDAAINSRYDPRAVVKVVKNPLKFLGVPAITPQQLSGILFAWGEASFNATSFSASNARQIDREVATVTPSIGQVYAALAYLGVNLEHPIDDNDVSLVIELLAPQRRIVSPQVVSDPYLDIRREEYEISVPTFGRLDETAMSFEPGFNAAMSINWEFNDPTLVNE